MRKAIWIVLVLAVTATLAAAQDDGDPKAPERLAVLKTTSPWRVWQTMAPPLVMSDGKIEVRELAADWAMKRTAEPGDSWTGVDFDDSGWPRMFGILMKQLRHFDFQPAMVARECRRARFEVTDPDTVEDLRLEVGYYGGVIVSLNGKEIARGSIADLKHEGETLARPYGPEAQAQDGEVVLKMLDRRLRKLDPITIDKSLLRKGVNVLAIETVRTAYLPEHVGSKGKGVHIMWGNCGLRELALTAAPGSGLVSSASRPKGLQVWNSDLSAGDFDQDWGEPGQPLKPIRIVAARNGTFSGKVVVGCDEPIRGLQATIERMQAPAGGAELGTKNIEVRFAAPGGEDRSASDHYGREVTRFEKLLSEAPEVVEVVNARPTTGWLYPKDYPTVDSAGAVVPVWVTVSVPADARPGQYEGSLRISAAGHDTVTVPVSLTVSPYALPSPRDFETFMDVMQSPDTLAIEYDVEMWSKRHWELIEQSLRQTARAGTRVAYVPLIAETNMGNAQSMVRWVKKDDGFIYDFMIVDRYLDLVEKTQGKPDMVVLVVWDIYVDKQAAGKKTPSGESVAEERTEQGGKGPAVTAVVDGKITMHQMPHYADAQALEAWRPMVEQLAERMKERGWTDRLAVGISTDTKPIEEAVNMWKTLLPNAGWVRHAHSGHAHESGVPVVYNADVWAPRFIVNRRADMPTGWARPDKPVWAQFVRVQFDGFPPVSHRLQVEMSVFGNQNGIGRIGGDFWQVFKTRRGRRSGRVSTGRFPRTTWRNLDIVTAYLEPGPDGPVSSARYELMLEGLQECEARIVLAKALADDASRGKLGESLAKRCEQLMADRDLAAARGTSSFVLGNHFTSNAIDGHSWWHINGDAGQLWFVGSPWQQRSQQLYDLAAEVAAKLETR
jgi:hypothetical protein